MKKEHFDELLKSVKEAVAIERGQAKPSRTVKVARVNWAKAFRRPRPANEFDAKEWQW